jgi:hypothetical protein
MFLYDFIYLPAALDLQPVHEQHLKGNRTHAYLSPRFKFKQTYDSRPTLRALEWGSVCVVDLGIVVAEEKIVNSKVPDQTTTRSLPKYHIYHIYIYIRQMPGFYT